MPDLVIDNPHNASFTAATVTENAAYLYLPAGVDLSRLPFVPVHAELFSQADGSYAHDAVHLTSDGFLSLPGRAAGRGMDAVVILCP